MRDPPRTVPENALICLCNLVALWLTFAVLLLSFVSILVSVLIHYVKHLPISARIRQAPPKGMTAVYGLAPTTRTIQALQDPNGGAAVSRLWRTSMNNIKTNNWIIDIIEILKALKIMQKVRCC